MNRHTSITLIAAALLGCCTSLAPAQNVDALPTITGASIDKTNDFIMVRDASVSAETGALRKMTIAELANVPALFSAELTSGPVTSSGGVSAIADAALSIAKTSGLQTAVDKATEVVNGVPTTGGADGDFRINGLTGVVYKKISGTWTAQQPGTVPQVVYPVSGTSLPGGGTGNNSDLAMLYSGGEAYSWAEKSGGSWVTRGTFLRSTDSAPDFTTLTNVSTTVTQTCSAAKTVQNAKLTLAGSWTLAIASPVAGMRGTILITYTSGSLALPANSKTVTGFALSTTVGAVDRLEWVYDGTDFLFTLQGAALVTPTNYDTESQTYMTLVGMSDTAHKNALDVFVKGLKTDGLWTLSYGIWPFYGGTPTATTHAKDLKGSYTGTFAGGVTYDGVGITGNGTTGIFDSNFNFAAVSALNSAAVYVYCRTQTIASTKALFGASVAGVSYFTATSNATSMGTYGANSSNAGLVITTSSDFRKHLVLERTNSTTATMYANASAATHSHAPVNAVAADIFFMGYNYGDTAYDFIPVNYGLAATTQALSAGQWTNWRARVDALMAAWGRTSP